MPNLPPDADRIYKDIRKQVQKKYDKRKEFAIHMAMFLMAMYGLWGVLSLAGLFADLARIFSVLWGMGVVAHLLDFGFHELQERAIQQELQRVGIFPYDEINEKAKNTLRPDSDPRRYARLTADGELIDIDQLEYDDTDSAISGEAHNR